MDLCTSALLVHVRQLLLTFCVEGQPVPLDQWRAGLETAPSAVSCLHPYSHLYLRNVQLLRPIEPPRTASKRCGPVFTCKSYAHAAHAHWVSILQHADHKKDQAQVPAPITGSAAAVTARIRSCPSLTWTGPLGPLPLCPPLPSAPLPSALCPLPLCPLHMHVPPPAGNPVAAAVTSPPGFILLTYLDWAPLPLGPPPCPPTCRRRCGCCCLPSRSMRTAYMSCRRNSSQT